MGRDLRRVEKVIYFCAGGACAREGANALIRDARAHLKTEGWHGTVHTVKTLCSGQCEHAPVVAVQPDNLWYRRMDVRKWEQVVQEHLRDGRPVQEFLLAAGSDCDSPEDRGEGRSRGTPFVLRDLPDHGPVSAAALNPWESNFYPLLLDLFVNRFQGLRFRVAELGDRTFALTRPAVVAYDGVRASVDSDAGKFSFVIGILRDSEPTHLPLKGQKITEALFIEASPGGLFLASSLEGRPVLEVFFPAPAPGSDPWGHFTRIHLEEV